MPKMCRKFEVAGIGVNAPFIKGEALKALKEYTI